MIVGEEFYDEVFEALYEEAVPGLEELENSEYSEETNVAYLHYLDGERQVEIIEEYCDEYEVPLSDRRQIKFNVILGKGPSTSIENVNRARKEEGLDPVEQPFE